jgi:hypothetical protein
MLLVVVVLKLVPVMVTEVVGKPAETLRAVMVGAPFIVTVTVATDAPTVYVIVAVPSETPTRTPVDEPIAATAVLLLVHTPPGVASLSVVVVPAQIVVVPVIGDATALTVTTVVA